MTSSQSSEYAYTSTEDDEKSATDSEWNIVSHSVFFIFATNLFCQIFQLLLKKMLTLTTIACKRYVSISVLFLFLAISFHCLQYWACV